MQRGENLTELSTKQMRPSRDSSGLVIVQSPALVTKITQLRQAGRGPDAVCRARLRTSHFLAFSEADDVRFLFPADLEESLLAAAWCSAVHASPAFTAEAAMISAVSLAGPSAGEPRAWASRRRRFRSHDFSEEAALEDLRGRPETHLLFPASLPRCLPGYALSQTPLAELMSVALSASFIAAKELSITSTKQVASLMLPRSLDNTAAERLKLLSTSDVEAPPGVKPAQARD